LGCEKKVGVGKAIQGVVVASSGHATSGAAQKDRLAVERSVCEF
jgi:hypothetical protein